jgi:hypothetical protein
MLSLDRFPIRVHIWGGLGSQCFAWAIAIDLKVKFPTRKVHLIQHDSGVTRRISEISFLNEEFKITSIQDYVENLSLEAPYSQLNNISYKVKTISRSIFRNVLLSFGIIALANDDYAFAKLKPWVLSLRGHYSHRTISKSTFLAMSKNRKGPFNLKQQPFEEPIEYLGLHWRLGDLQNLKRKKPLDSRRIIDTVKLVTKKNVQIQEVRIASDSISHALFEFDSNFSFPRNFSKSTSTIAALREMISSNIFVGTNSKLSAWIAIARFYGLENAISYLPGEIIHHLPQKARAHSCTIIY